MPAILATSPSSTLKLIATRLRDLHAVEPAIDVLPLELLLGAIQRGPVENARLGHADVLERLLQRIFLELLDSDDVDLTDGRPLLHDDDQHVALGLEPHVAEETGGVQRFDCCRCFFVVDTVTDFDRQIVEDGAGIGALHAFDANVLDSERLEGHGRVRQEHRREQKQEPQPSLGARARAPRVSRLRKVGKGH